MTAMGFLRKMGAAPSHTAHALMPLFLQVVVTTTLIDITPAISGPLPCPCHALLSLASTCSGVCTPGCARLRPTEGCVAGSSAYMTCGFCLPEAIGLVAAWEVHTLGDCACSYDDCVCCDLLLICVESEWP